MTAGESVGQPQVMLNPYKKQGTVGSVLSALPELTGIKLLGEVRTSPVLEANITLKQGRGKSGSIRYHFQL